MFDWLKVFHKSYAFSWLGHFLFFFLISSLSALMGFNYQLIIGAALGQEGTQLDIYGIRFKKQGKGIPYYDYIGDLVADSLAIFLAYTIF